MLCASFSCPGRSIDKKLQLSNLATFALSPGKPPYKISVYVPGTKVRRWLCNCVGTAVNSRHQALGGPLVKGFFRCGRAALHAPFSTCIHFPLSQMRSMSCRQEYHSTLKFWETLDSGLGVVPYSQKIWQGIEFGSSVVYSTLIWEWIRGHKKYLKIHQKGQEWVAVTALFLLHDEDR